MSEEISVGVQILLERGKTSPDETREEYGKWAGIRDAVFNYKERNERSAWLRGLTEHEINLLFDMFGANAREQFDEWVMKTILGTGEDEQTAPQSGLRYKATERYVQGFTDPRLYQNAIPPGTMISVTAGGSGGSGQVQIKPESVMSKLKKELGL